MACDPSYLILKISWAFGWTDSPKARWYPSLPVPVAPQIFPWIIDMLISPDQGEFEISALNPSVDFFRLAGIQAIQV